VLVVGEEGLYLNNRILFFILIIIIITIILIIAMIECNDKVLSHQLCRFTHQGGLGLGLLMFSDIFTATHSSTY
jgi:hypothetical protein